MMNISEIDELLDKLSMLAHKFEGNELGACMHWVASKLWKLHENPEKFYESAANWSKSNRHGKGDLSKVVKNLEKVVKYHDQISRKSEYSPGIALVHKELAMNQLETAKDLERFGKNDVKRTDDYLEEAKGHIKKSIGVYDGLKSDEIEIADNGLAQVHHAEALEVNAYVCLETFDHYVRSATNIQLSRREQDERFESCAKKAVDSLVEAYESAKEAYSMSNSWEEGTITHEDMQKAVNANMIYGLAIKAVAKAEGLCRSSKWRDTISEGLCSIEDTRNYVPGDERYAEATADLYFEIAKGFTGGKEPKLVL